MYSEERDLSGFEQIDGKPVVGLPGDILTLEIVLYHDGQIVASRASDLFGSGGSHSAITLTTTEPPWKWIP